VISVTVECTLELPPESSASQLDGGYPTDDTCGRTFPELSSGMNVKMRLRSAWAASLLESLRDYIDVPGLHEHNPRCVVNITSPRCIRGSYDSSGDRVSLKVYRHKLDTLRMSPTIKSFGLVLREL
jgi:hypothetical protein